MRETHRHARDRFALPLPVLRACPHEPAGLPHRFAEMSVAAANVMTMMQFNRVLWFV